MNKYLKEFFHRGLMFAGFGPVIMGIIYLVLEKVTPDFTVSGDEIFVAIISTYLLAFIHAGVSVFNGIENWSTMKSLLCHFSSLYVIYVICYLMNSWIPFDIKIVGIFTGIFVATYFLVWIIVYLSVRSSTKKLNSKINS